jgi:hypothetical protein
MILAGTAVATWPKLGLVMFPFTCHTNNSVLTENVALAYLGCYVLELWAIS